MAIQNSSSLSPREYEIQQYEKQMLELQMEHTIRVKQMELELQKLESKWSAWIKLPFVLLTLPLRILLVIPLSIYAATKQAVPEAYWRWLK